MSADLNLISKRFRQMSKFIYLSNIAAEYAAEVRKTGAGAYAQDAAANADEANTINKVITPFNNSVTSAAKTIDGMGTTASTAVKNMLQQIVAVDLGLKAGVSIPVVGAALTAAMVNVSGTVAASGSNGSNATGICMYFYNNFNIVLPQSGEPNIPDSYIQSDIWD